MRGTRIFGDDKIEAHVASDVPAPQDNIKPADLSSGWRAARYSQSIRECRSDTRGDAGGFLGFDRRDVAIAVHQFKLTDGKLSCPALPRKHFRRCRHSNTPQGA